MTDCLTALLVIITGYYAWVTHRILKANEHTAKAVDQQIKSQYRHDIFARTFEQVKRLEDRDFRVIRQYVLGERDGQYPTNDNSKNMMIREFSHTMDTIGTLYCKGYLDRDLLIDLYGGLIVNGYNKVDGFVNYVLRKMKVKRYQEYFKNMAEEVEQEYRRRYPHDNWLNLDIKDLVD